MKRVQVWAEIKKLYEKGLNDVAISEQLSITVNRVRAWRKRNNMPANRGIQSKAFKNDSKLWELYKQGFNDTEIATFTELTPGKVYYWRRSNKLRGNVSTDNIQSKQIDEKYMLKLYKQGFSDPYIARACGTYQGYVLSWRNFNNLPPVSIMKSRAMFKKADKIPAPQIFDDASLFYSNDIVKMFMSSRK